MSSRHIGTALVATVFSISFGVVGIACGGSGDGALGVDVSFEPGFPRLTRDEALRVGVYLISDCDEVALGERPDAPVASTYAIRDVGMGPLGGAVAPGAYGLYGLAQDANCAVVAASCAPVEITGDTAGPLQVALAPFAGPPCGSDEVCVLEDGQCVSAGGTGGASGAGGSGGSAGSGGTGGSNGNGGTGGMAGNCTGQPDQTMCTVGPTDGMCRNGECCTGCWDGGSCLPGNKTQNCGSGGEMCEFVPGCPSN